MLSNGLDKVKWHCYRQAERFGVLGLLAVLLTLASLLVYLTLIQPAKQALLDKHLTSNIQKDNETGTNQAGDLQAQMGAFTENLPIQTKKTSQIEQIIAIAETQALQLSAVNYQSKQEHELIKTDMKFSVQSDYPRLKGFINEVLYQFPNVSLNALNMQRIKRDGELVRSSIQLTLYYSQNQ